MKHAGSVRPLTDRNLLGSKIIRFFVVLCLSLSFCQSFTPPRIIYGGWTPILPGHPFYFGPARRRNVEQQHNSLSYNQHFHQHQIHPSYHEQNSPVLHNVEHHYEQHIQFEPGQFDHYTPDQREVHPYSGGHQTTIKVGPGQDAYTQGHKTTIKVRPDHNAYTHQGPQTTIKLRPDQNTYTQGPQTTIKVRPDQNAYTQYPLHPQQQKPAGLGKDVHTTRYPSKLTHNDNSRPHAPKAKFPSSGHKMNKNIFAYYPPQSAYEGPKQPQQDLDYKPVYFETPRKPLDILENPHQFVPYILPDVPLKTLNIPDLDSLSEGKEKTYLRITPLGNIDPGTIKNIGQINFDQIQYMGNGKQQTYPVIKDPSAGSLKYPMIDTDQIQYLGPGNGLKHETYAVIKDSSGGSQKYPVMKDTSGGTPKYPVIKDSFGGSLKYPEIHLDQIRYQEPGKHKSYTVMKNSQRYPVKDSSGSSQKSPMPVLTYGPVTKLKYGAGSEGIQERPYNMQNLATGYKSANIFKGTDFPLETYQTHKRPMNPIDTKNYGNSHLQSSGILKMNNKYNLPVLSDIYPSNPDLHDSKVKYYTPLTKTSSGRPYISKSVLSPTILSKDFATQSLRNYLGPPKYTPARPFYPKTILPGPMRFPYRPLPKTLLHLPLKTIVSEPIVGQVRTPSYLQKGGVKLQTHYKSPNVIANIRGSPALVEREVAIIHLPINTDGHTTDEKEYLYFTASTPESTQILDLNNGSNVPYTGNFNKHAPLLSSNNDTSYTRIVFDYEDKDKDVGTTAFVVDPATSSEGQRSTSQEIDSNDIHSSDENNPQYQDDYQYIFVSSSGVHPDNEDDPHKPGSTKKQFFHAYYAPGDHRPPPGYTKMTVREFNNLFKNAEIRYVDKDPTISRQGEDDASELR